MRQRNASQIISHPPPIQGFEVKHTTKLRFITNAAVNQNFTYQNLLDAICIATTAIAPYDLFSSVKLKQIEVWSIAAVGTSSSCSVVFDGATAGSVGDLVTHTDTSTGIEPAHLKVRPQKKTLASNYQLSSAAVAFYMDLPTVGSIVDVSLVFRGSTQGAALAAQNASIGAIVGSTFWRGIDGLAVATTKFLAPPGVQQF